MATATTDTDFDPDLVLAESARAVRDHVLRRVDDRLAASTREVRASLGSVFAGREALEACVEQLAADCDTLRAELAGLRAEAARDRAAAAALAASLRAASEDGFRRLAELLKALPVPQVVNHNEIAVPPASVTVQPAAVRVEQPIQVLPAPVRNEISVPVPVVEVVNQVAPTPVTVENKVDVNAVPPPREKTIEYDQQSRPVRTVERDVPPAGEAA